MENRKKMHVPVYNVHKDFDQELATYDQSPSGYSIASGNSTCPFLHGEKEKDVYVVCKLEESSVDETECGIGRIRPGFLQACATIKVFVFFMCLLCTVASSMTTGYLNSVITTIEKRFEIGSSVSGVIAASYEFGSLVAVIFVSFLGGGRHIPKWIGRGVSFMGVGALLFALPHVIAPKYSVHTGVISNFTEENICRIPLHQKFDSEMCFDQNSGNWIYVLILIVAQIFIGTGGTPILTLGITYVDNHVSKEKAPAYLAFIYATGALGPVLGYALGALLLQFYVDTFTYDVKISAGHPRWIGAWWGGFIICGLSLLMLAIPFMAFPKELVNEKRKMLEEKAKEDLLSPDVKPEMAKDYGKTIKDLPRSILRLLKNSVFMVLCVAVCCEISIVSGFVVFLPKYIETQFGTSTSVANLFTGGIGIPGAVIGILIGGYLTKRLQLQSKGALQLILLLNGLALGGYTFFFYLGCDNLKIAGATFPYFNSSGHKIFEANLTSACNQNCACSSNYIEPICGVNGITYFSPCHAGCTGLNRFYQTDNENERSFNYSGCSCITSHHSIAVNHEVVISPLATSGPCKTTCERMLPFLILLVVMTFCCAGTQMPILMVTLRSVSQEERAFALGMQFVILRLFGYIPAPIMFGKVIDTACLLWKQRCKNMGSCLLYDIVQFRYKYVGSRMLAFEAVGRLINPSQWTHLQFGGIFHSNYWYIKGCGIAAGLKVIGLIFFFATWVFIRQRNETDIKEFSVGELTPVVSLEKLNFCTPHTEKSLQEKPEQLEPGGGDTASDVMVQRRTDQPFVLSSESYL